jgi:nicastrin
MSCDNEGFGWNNQETCSHQWNPFANNLLYHDFQDFPIMVIGDATPFKNCFEKFMQSNIPTSYPLCAAELTADMSVAVSTESCYRRAYLPMPFLTVGGFSCDALGGLSVWGTPFHLPNTSQDVVMVTTKLDTLSMFPRSASLGGGEAAGIVALLAMAEAIGQLKRKGELENTTKSIIFTFFNGESWDYIGSSRLVHDMARKDFTSFDIDQISHFVELSHLGFTNHTAKQSLYYAHLHRDDNIFRNLAMFAKSNNISIAKAVGSALPPSSLLSFLKANSSISSVVLGDYDGGYINRFYGSRFDTIDNLAYVNDSITFNASLEKVAERLAKVSSALAATVLELSGAACASNSCHPVANKELVKDLVECFLRNFSCPRFQEAIPDSVDMPNSTVIGYVGIFRSRNQAPQVYLPNAVRNLLTYYLGDWTANVTAKQCDNISMDGYSQRIFSRGPSYNSSADTPTGTCVLANTFFLNSLSPVFEGENRETYRSDLVGEYSSWAESSWITLQVRLYITTGLGEELGTFFGGLVLFGIFILLSIQLFRRGRNIFHQRIIPPSDDAEQ